MKEKALLSVDKQQLLNRIEGLEDPTILMRVQQLIDPSNEEELDDPFEVILKEVLEEVDKAQEPLLIHQESSSQYTLLTRLEHQLAPWSFGLSLLFLMSLGLVIQELAQLGDLLLSDQKEREIAHIYYLLTPMLVVWPYFFWEYFQYWKKSKGLGIKKRTKTLYLLAAFFPVLRFATPRFSDQNLIWLPAWQWSYRNDTLFDTLRKKFSLPMILIAALIVPILFIEMKYEEQMRAYVSDIDFYLEVSQAFIWMAFTFEFVLMIFVSRERGDYAVKHWMDLLIILVPLISAFRSMRVLRVLRVQNLARAYRVKGLFLKLRQTLFLADIVHRLLYPNPKKHLKTLQKRLKANKRQRYLLEEQVGYAIERLRKKEGKVNE
ncbi:hypothetical protein [Algivirga pacifica]|uniref:Potassium channel protein n=1 Tax=Algivirga pacifica TaxID=1162670 RepID=A0ABP9CVX6_9BACT